MNENIVNEVREVPAENSDNNLIVTKDSKKSKVSKSAVKSAIAQLDVLIKSISKKLKLAE